MATERFWELVGALLAFGLGLAALILSRGLPQMEGGYPGPALFPGILGVLLVCCGLGVFLGALLQAGHSRGVAVEGRKGLVNTLGVLLSLGLAPVMLARLGLIPTAVAYALFACLLLRARWQEVLAVGVAMGLFVYVVFMRFLGVQG
ncbi:tripartite tricarboxylate transporter TctB family protein [Calidithermus roseus]|uniref:Tripartite tricarboxylate transporter TctB family protein n=1 Tax=Calidithermus roseus TaxID=1644118 RepID=A0A399EPH9_9DEIN|nr:tripartite tricarboxylate transporter TctB family protein [Calidithermus roseus]RIH85380.1 Tripartite tricarboxylate transporter TctB family protein [Calidithermus roseus]